MIGACECPFDETDALCSPHDDSIDDFMKEDGICNRPWMNEKQRKKNNNNGLWI